MKLQILFILIDLLIIIAYPFVYLIYRIRKGLGVK